MLTVVRMLTGRTDAYGCLRMLTGLTDAYGCVRMLTEVYGCVRMRTDAYGCVRVLRMLTDAYGCLRVLRVCNGYVTVIMMRMLFVSLGELVCGGQHVTGHWSQMI